jgi:hypothetical protein
MQARQEGLPRVEQAYRRPEWMGAGVKYDNGTVAIEGLLSFGQAENQVVSPAFAGVTVPLNAAPALFRAGYEDVVHTWGVAPAKEEGLG